MGRAREQGNGGGQWGRTMGDGNRGGQWERLRSESKVGKGIIKGSEGVTKAEV